MGTEKEKEFLVLEPITTDRYYYRGENVKLSDKKVIEQLKKIKKIKDATNKR